jgi:hypothetical protein
MVTPITSVATTEAFRLYPSTSRTASRKKLEVESADEKSPLEQFIDSKPTDPFNLPNQLDLFDPDEL